MTQQYYIESFLDDVQGEGQAIESAEPLSFDWCLSATDDELHGLFERLPDLAPLTEAQDMKVAAFIRALLPRQWDVRDGNIGLPEWMGSLAPRLYEDLGQASRTRSQLLQLIATHGVSELRDFAEWLNSDPPTDYRAVLLAMSPLFRRRDYDPRLLFPRLLDALVHRSLAASVIDLANYVTVSEMVERHPAADRATHLIGLLAKLTNHLGRLEEDLGSHQDPAADLAAKVEESVALAVAICHALALIGDEAAIGKLFQALELRHRRLRTEAAAALAKFGQPAGAESLAALASEPIVRLRVLHYAEELDCLHAIDPQFQTLEARAEAELALWLAQPAQFGIPPTSLELVDSRSLFWPGYDDEVDCYLFRYSYQMEVGSLSNIGIAGPLTHAFAADMGDLSPDAIYAAFAGWQADHEEIYEIDNWELEEAHRVDVAKLERRVRDAGYVDVRPLRMGFFFGERALIARARRDGVEGIAVADFDTVHWSSTASGTRPVGPDEVYSIYKGRKLLRNFND